MSPSAVTIVLDDKRKRIGAWWHKLQHAVGGVPLLIAGIHRLQGPGGVEPLAIAEVLVAATLLILFARDLRAAATARPAASQAPDDAVAEHSDAHSHTGSNWFDVVAGVMLIVESAQASHEGGKPFFARPNFLLGVVTLVIGLLHGRIASLSWKRRELHVDESGIRARLGRFRSFAVSWPEVRDIAITAKTATIETATASHMISFGRYRNADAIRRALTDWRAAHALPRAV